jgi:hypothetical protein
LYQESFNDFSLSALKVFNTTLIIGFLGLREYASPNNSNVVGGGYMRKVKVSALALVSVLTCAMVTGLGGGRAMATLEGENGPIVYVSGGESASVAQVEGNSEEEVVESSSEVITTNPLGQNQTTVAENNSTSSFITAATISAPDTSGTHTIAYAESDIVCYQSIELDEGGTEYQEMECPYGDEFLERGYFTTDVSIRTVTVDQNGQPTGAPEHVVTIGAGENPEYALNMVQHMSFSPDSTNVVETRLVINGKGMGIQESDEDDEEEEMCFGFCVTFEQVMLDDGTVNTIVPFRFDPYLNGGYGQNGNIYYSMSDEEYEGYGYEGAETVNVDIWYIPAGGPLDTAYRVTDTDDIDEVFVDALPDDTKLLVWDARSQRYYYVLLDDCMAVMTNCAVQLVDDVPSNVELVGVSPDGSSFYGTQYPEYEPLDEMLTRTAFMELVELESPGTILSLRSAIATATTVNDLTGVQDWAPKFVQQPITVVQGKSTTPKLSNTGSQATVAMFVLMSVLMVAGLSTLPRKN